LPCRRAEEDSNGVKNEIKVVVRWGYGYMEVVQQKGRKEQQHYIKETSGRIASR
jgi:hypothetical protein